MKRLNKKPKIETAGWYVEIPIDIKTAFDMRFPHKGAKKALTVAAIIHALKLTDDIDDLGKIYENAD